MPYATLADLKRELNIALTDTTDDVLLQRALDAAEAFIDAHFSARFEPVTATRRYGPQAIAGLLLYLDAPLLGVTSLTNGDGATIPANAYHLLPRNAAPHWAIRLRADANLAWYATVDDPIAVAGAWGYAATPPLTVQRLAVRMAAYYYRQRDAQVFDVTYTPELGTVTVPKGAPADVLLMLERLQAAYQLA